MEQSDGSVQFNIGNFVKARYAEIQSVKQMLSNQKGVKLAFQKLPVHMRRRVMAHNTKRVPISIRSKHKNQLLKSGGLNEPQKRPSRKFRRRPKCLNDEIARRQRVFKWMETHMWHAKRFKMISKWGYKIPYQPNDKAFRACYRATQSHCLLQDISYISCIEIHGPQCFIIDELKKMTRLENGLSIGAKVYTGGMREGNSLFYKSNENKPIGNVRFHWKPNLDNKTSILWLWVHAAYYDEILNQLIDLFDLKIGKNPKYSCFSNENSGVGVAQLKYELNRFRLSGPLSQSVLTTALKPIEISKGSEQWLQDFLANDEERQIFSDQLHFWDDIKPIQSPAHLSPHLTFSLVVSDPRFSLPKKRTKAVTEVTSSSAMKDFPKNISCGPIWDSFLRDNVTLSKKTNNEINEIRREMLVPGADIEEQGVPIPLMFIQRPGLPKSGYGSGYDLIIPKSWAQVFWHAFIMRGARPGGLRETESIQFEMQRLPIFSPETLAGKTEDQFADNLYKTTYFNLPPNKRINYNKLSISSPFCCNWKLLCEEWNLSSSEEPSVLTDKEFLQALQNYLCKRNAPEQILNNAIFLDNLLVPVKVSLDKGSLHRYSLIALPESGDLSKKAGPVEPKVQDENHKIRQELRRSHKKYLQKLKRKRKLVRFCGEKIHRDEECITKFREKMQNLLLPQTVRIRTSCSREVIGFVSCGGISFRCGKAVGLGFIPIGVLKVLLTKRINNILVRNTNSRQYRIANIDLNINDNY